MGKTHIPMFPSLTLVTVPCWLHAPNQQHVRCHSCAAPNPSISLTCRPGIIPKLPFLVTPTDTFWGMPTILRGYGVTLFVTSCHSVSWLVLVVNPPFPIGIGGFRQRGSRT